MRLVLAKPFSGDFDEMVKRRAIRVGVTFNRTHYFIDQGQERGLTYEALKSFENDPNTDLKTGNLKVHVVIVPMSRDQLQPALASGKIDMVAAMVTVRPELETLVAFSEPTRTNVSQVVVTGPGAPSIATVDDLAGQEVFVRKASAITTPSPAERRTESARQAGGGHRRGARRARRRRHARNGQRRSRADHGRRRLSGRVLEPGVHGITVHKDVSVRTGGHLAVAFRKENPTLREAVNDWIRKHGKGDAFRNTIERRYLQNDKYVKNAAAEAERQKFRAVGDMFKKYGAQYNVDYLLMAAQGYQESTLDQNVKSPVGAVGVDAADAPHRKGTERRRHHADRCQHPCRCEVHAFHDGPVLQGRAHGQSEQGSDDLCGLQRRAGTPQTAPTRNGKRGLNPNIWFDNVERVASERIGRETVTYVSNIYKYCSHVPPAQRAAGPTRSGEGGGWEAQVNAHRCVQRGSPPACRCASSRRLPCSSNRRIS